MFGFDPQVRDGAMNCLVEIYRHVGERVRMDLGKKGLPQSRCVMWLFHKPHFVGALMSVSLPSLMFLINIIKRFCKSGGTESLYL